MVERDPHSELGYWQRVHARLGAGSFGFIVLLAGVVSSKVLFQPQLYEMWGLRAVLADWLEYFAEVVLIGAAMWVSVVAVEQRRPPEVVAAVGEARARRAAWAAWAALLVAALVLPALLLVWANNWRFSGQWRPLVPLALVGEALKFSMLGAFVYAARVVHRMAERANVQALALEAARRELQQQASEAQLRLLQAQIEPHFLFNTLANVRRLYRKQPAAGALAIDNLMTYLQAALPQVWRTESTLGEEFELARAYLALFRMRMGPRLRYALDIEPALRALPFPPMVLVTLAENAVKHGLAPAGGRGTVWLHARRRGERLEVSVADDGAGFGPASSGTGVGLANIRRQLAVRFGPGAVLALEEREGGGVQARITLPMVAPAGVAAALVAAPAHATAAMAAGAR